MPNVVRFPGERTVTLQSDPGDEAARSYSRCECGSVRFNVYQCGEIACADCDALPHDPLRGTTRAHWTQEVSLLQRSLTIRFEDPEPEASPG